MDLRCLVKRIAVCVCVCVFVPSLALAEIHAKDVKRLEKAVAALENAKKERKKELKSIQSEFFTLKEEFKSAVRKGGCKNADCADCVQAYKDGPFEVLGASLRQEEHACLKVSDYIRAAVSEGVLLRDHEDCVKASQCAMVKFISDHGVRADELHAKIKQLELQKAKEDEEIEEAQTELDDAKPDCVDCSQKGKDNANVSVVPTPYGPMSIAGPTTGQLALGALQSLVPAGVNIGLGVMANQSYNSNYGNYMAQCTMLGVPCMAPTAFNPAMGMGLGGMGGMGMMGGMGGMGMMNPMMMGGMGMGGYGMGGMGMMNPMMMGGMAGYGGYSGMGGMGMSPYMMGGMGMGGYGMGGYGMGGKF